MLLTPQDSEPPAPPREFRGVWVATVDNIDWPSKRDLSTEAQRRELVAILDKAASLNLNAVIFQVRPHGDALYASEIEPWSEYLTGLNGRAPKPLWDPLAFAVEEAHKRGLELHAWINPYRAWHPAAKAPAHATHITKSHPDRVRPYGRFVWMDPADPNVQQRTLAVADDIVRRYDVDGLHIDDYFYPFPVRDGAGKVIDFPDDKLWQAYRASGGTASRGDWRRSKVDTLVRDLNATIKKRKPWVKFGISPFGIWRPGHPEGIKAGVDQYAQIYADVRKWLREGWCDYLSPQLYWRIEQTAQSYPRLLDWWVEQNVANRHIWPGNYASQVANGWPAQEIVEQIEITRKSSATGNVLFSMKPIMRGTARLDQALAKSYAQPALVPASPWLGEQKPEAPKLTGKRRVEDRYAVAWASAPDIRFWAVYGHKAGKWTFLRSTSERRVELPGDLEAIAVSGVSRTGQEGPRLIVPIED